MPTDPSTPVVPATTTPTSSTPGVAPSDPAGDRPAATPRDVGATRRPPRSRRRRHADGVDRAVGRSAGARRTRSRATAGARDASSLVVLLVLLLAWIGFMVWVPMQAWGAVNKVDNIPDRRAAHRHVGLQLPARRLRQP